MSPLLMAGGCLLVSLAWNLLFWDRSYGMGMPVFVVIVIAFLAATKRLRFAGNAITLTAHLALLLYLACCVTLYRNDLILGATITAIYVGLAALALSGRSGYSFLNAIGIAESVAGSATRLWGAGAEIYERLSTACFGDEPEGRTTPTKVVVGLLFSIPFLILFGWLFTSADPLFEIKVDELFDLIWKPVFWIRCVVIVAMGWGICGYLGNSAARSTLASRFDTVPPKQKYDGVSTLVFLAMINLLFVAFLAIQLEYLFGGETVIRNTTLTYAEYAHKGFYELWTVVVIVSAVIAVTNHGLREVSPRVRRSLELTWVLLIAQTVVIIASSLKRIWVYEEAYGYTQLRILVALFQVWMAACFFLFIFKILQRRSFTWLASSAICTALVFLVGVSTFSIDQFIARKNVDRYLGQQKEIDVNYLAQLSTDTCTEIRRLEASTTDSNVKAAARELLVKQREEAGQRLNHWSSWNRSLARATK